MFDSTPYRRYVEQLKSGCFTHFSEDEMVEIVADFVDDYDTEGASKALDLALKWYPNNVQLIKYRILTMIEQGQLQTAELLLEDYWDDGTTQTMELCFLLYLKLGLYEQACDIYIDAVECNKISSLTACDWLTDPHYEMPRETRIDALCRLHQADSGNLLTSYEVSMHLAHLKAYDEAIKVANKTLDIDAYHIRTWELLARCYYICDNIEKCEEACDYALAIDDLDGIARFLRGYIRFERQEYKAAIEDFLVAYKMRLNYIRSDAKGDNVYGVYFDDPNREIDSICELIACSYNKLSEPAHAIEFWKILCERRPNDVRYHHELTINLMEIGNLPMALKACDKALECDPENYECAMLRVSLLLSCHKSIDDITSALRYVLHIKPDSVQALLTMAELSRQLGGEDLAYKTYCYVRDLQPEDELAQKLVASYFDSIGEPMPKR